MLHVDLETAPFFSSPVFQLFKKALAHQARPLTQLQCIIQGPK